MAQYISKDVVSKLALLIFTQQQVTVLNWENKHFSVKFYGLHNINGKKMIEVF